MTPLPIRLRFLLFPSILLFSSSLLALTGCGGGGVSEGPANSIKGKVTLNNQPVGGTVVFIGSDKKELSSPISKDGEYVIPNPPKGEGQFLVKSGVMAGTIPADKKGVKDSPKEKDPTKEVASLGGVEPPAKYALPNNGIPKFDYTGGRMTYNIELQP